MDQEQTEVTVHPFYARRDWMGERSKLDKVSGFDWLFMLSLGLTCAMCFRLAAIALQILRFPTGPTLFLSIVLFGLTAISIHQRGKFPRLLNTVAWCSALGFVVGFVL